MAAATGACSHAELLLAAAATLQTWKKKSCDTKNVVLESVEQLRHDSLDVVQSHSIILEVAIEGELVPLDSLISAVGQSVPYAKHPSCVLHLLGRLMVKSIHVGSITAVLTRIFVDILSAQPKLWPLMTSQVQLLMQELAATEHPALVQALAPLVQSMALNSIMIPAECLRDICNILVQQVHCYKTSLNSEGYLKVAVASVSSLIQVYLHLYVVNDDESLLAAASLCMDHFRSHICLPLDWTDDTSLCHCLDLVLSHMCELTNRGLSVCCHLSVLKQHVSGITRTALQMWHFVAFSWLLCKQFMVPPSVQLILSIVSTLLQTMTADQKISFMSCMLLPLLQVAALPDVCRIGCVKKENVRMATHMLKEYLSWSNDACGSSEVTLITPLVSTPVYKSIVAAGNLSTLFYQSSEALLQWIGVLQELVETSETALLQSIVLIQHFPKLISDNHTEKALKILPSLAKDLQLGSYFLPVVIFYFPLLQDDHEKRLVLSALPALVGSSKAGLGQVLALILELSKNAKLLPTMIRVLYSVWEQQDAVYPHLHDLLIAPLPASISSSSMVDILLAKAITAKEMCETRAEVHGTELLGIVAAYFDESTLLSSLPFGTHALLLNVALAGLRALTEAEVIGRTAAFRNVVLKLLEDKRSLVQAGVCSFLEVLVSAPLDQSVSHLVFSTLWKHTVSEEIPVSTAAWLTLSACDLNDLLVSDIPNMLHNVMGLDATLSDDSPVTGKQVVSLLPCISFGAIEAFLCLLRKFLKHELDSLPKGAVSSALKKAKMPVGYKGLDDILSALRHTSMSALPSGLQLLMLEQPDQPSSDSRGRKQLMATALQKSKSTLTDLLSKELYPSYMVLDQFVQLHQYFVPEEWDKFVQVVFQQSVEAAKMSRCQDDVAQAMARQDLVQLIIDTHRVTHLREDNVLFTLVSLACLSGPGPSTSITQPALAAFEGQRFIHDVLSILAALATGALHDSNLGTWSSRVIMEIFAGWTCPADVLVAAVTSILKSVMSQPGGIAQLVVFNDTVVRLLKSSVHTFQISLIQERMDQTIWLLGISLNGLFSTTHGILPQVASVLSELMENVLVNHPTPSLALASLIPSMLMVDHSTDAVQLLFEQFVHDCNTTIASPVKAVALSTSLCAMFQVNLLPQELLMEYCDSMSRLPLSQQYAPLHMMFGSTLHWLSNFGCSLANKQLAMYIPLWTRALQHPSSQVSCCMALAGSLGVDIVHKGVVPRPIAEKKETVLPPLLLALQQFLSCDDAQPRGTMIWLLVKVVLAIRESESHTSDLVPLDLSYLPEHCALPSVFEVLKEEANVAVAGSAALDVVEKLLLSLVAMDGMPPSDWSGILSMLYHKGGPILQSSCVQFAIKFPACGSITFLHHSMVTRSVSRMSDNFVGVIAKALSLPVCPIDERCLWQLLYALCQVVHRGSLELAQSVSEALLTHCNNVGKSQLSQHCHTHIAQTLVSDVIETAAAQGMVNTVVSSPHVLHLLSKYLSMVLSDNLLQLLQCTNGESEEIKAVKCMLLAESAQFVKGVQWRKHVTAICDVSFVTVGTFARIVICLTKCLLSIVSDEENIPVLIKVLLHYIDGAKGSRKRLLVWMIVQLLSSTHADDCTLGCMAVASNLLFVGGVPSDFWEECLPASLCCAPIHASIDKKCMESVMELCFVLMPVAKTEVLNIVSAFVSSMSRQQRKASAQLTFVE